VIEPDGGQSWYQHGELHRDDGPAWIQSNGTQHWFWHSQEITEEEHAKLLAERKAKKSKRQ
jgi:hypothetical protein